VTRGTSYKFSLLKKCIIRPSWEIGHNSFFENPVSIRMVALERGLRGILEFGISDLGDLKFQRYIRFNIELMQSEKFCEFLIKFCINLV